MKTIDSTNILDSVNLLKFDTVTQKKIYVKKVLNIYNLIDDGQSKVHDILKDNKLNLQMVALSAGLDKKLYDNYREEAEQKIDEAKEINKKDSVYQKQADSLTKITAASDSIKPLYFQIKCLIQYHRKDLSVARDTGYAYINLNKDIVRSEDILK
jgi:hypothetical protein